MRRLWECLVIVVLSLVILSPYLFSILPRQQITKEVQLQLHAAEPLAQPKAEAEEVEIGVRPVSSSYFTQVKTFDGTAHDVDQAFNKWLRDEHVEVTHITSSCSGNGYMYLTVAYRATDN